MKLLTNRVLEVPGHELVTEGETRAALFFLGSVEELHAFCRVRPAVAVLAVAPPDSSATTLAGLRSKARKNGAQDCLGFEELEVHLGRALDYALERVALQTELDTWRHSDDVAEAANRRASQVLATVSHEIRGRMTVINFMSQLAVDPRTKDEKRSECLKVLKESSESLQSLLNDLLDHSKLLEGELSLSPTDFDLRDLLENTVSGFRIVAHEKGVAVRVEVDAAVPDALIGDPGRLRQILVNLVGNALKFTSTGSVTVQVSPGVRFAVVDTGIGIPKHLHERVFKPYAQAEHSTSRKYGGTGLGLAIASRLVELMGGKLELDSEPGVGTTFFFLAPALRAREVAPVAASAVELANLGILVVENQSHGSERVLQSEGLRTVSAESGYHALDRLREGEFGVALVDVVLSDFDGFLLAEEMRSVSPATRVVLLTSAGQRGDAARCLELGVAGYLTRPVESEDLVHAIRLVVAGGRSLVTRHTLREEKEKAPR